MQAKEIKFVVEHSDKRITTWNNKFDDKVENIINKLKHDQKWLGGKFLEISIAFDNNGVYYEVELDVKNSIYNLLICG
jgi:hypothetical protein